MRSINATRMSALPTVEGKQRSDGACADHHDVESRSLHAQNLGGWGFTFPVSPNTILCLKYGSLLAL
jgi:hypothetical protein